MNIEKKLRRVTRIGSYGIVIQNNNILLIKKQKGCYLGLLDLPGGGIEFDETPEDALKRELIEEVGLKIEKFTMFANFAHSCEVLKINDPFHFHHLGLIYKIDRWEHIENAIPEEIFGWYPYQKIDLELLTPFAKSSIEALES
ncbi:MAG: NUDIX domain-containing protein [Parachlamydiaceae bacterium]|nr:NUDIX domain-containing protein [Parachlamydiaceae bacterium]